VQLTPAHRVLTGCAVLTACCLLAAVPAVSVAVSTERITEAHEF
jgi:hypothetical protein